MARPVPFTREELERFAMLDAAAEARRLAAARQERARFLCLACRAPDGECVWECPTRCLCCGERMEPGTVHLWGRANTCTVEPDRPPRGLVARRTVSLSFPSSPPSTPPRMDLP